MEPQNVTCYFFGETHPTFLPLAEVIVGGSEAFHFTGYLLKLEITLFDYLVTSIKDHNSTYEPDQEGREVPIYIDRRVEGVTLDWDIAWYKQGPSNKGNYKTMAHYADYPMGHIPVSTSTSCFQSAPFSPSALYAPSAPLSPSAHFLPSDYNHMLAQFSDIFDPIENSSAPSEIKVGVTQEMADDIEVVEALTSRERLSVVPEVYLSAPQSPADSSVNLYSPMNSVPESWMVSSAVDVSSVQLDDDTPEPKAPEAPPPFTDTLHMILLARLPGARVVIGDEESAIFRTAPLPPVAMIAYVLAIWYSALLTRLKVLECLLWLLEQTDDPAYPDFLQVFANFVHIESHCGDAGCTNERLFSASFTPSTRHFLEIEHTEHALKSWLQNQGREVASDPLFATTSVLFGWVDPLDLIAVLQVSLRVTAIERQLLKEHNTIITFLMRGGRSLMEERMYRAQMEVSLFSKAIANLCEELKARYCPPTWSKTQLVQKTDEDLVTSQVTQLVDVDILPADYDQFELSSATREKCEAWLATSWQFEVDFPQSHEVPELYEHLSRHDNDFLSPLMEAWFGRVTHRTYITTSSADSKFLHTDNIKSFKAKKNKTPDALKSDFSILELKKQRAQAEVDMFSEAIARTAGIQCTDDGMYTSSGTAGTFESRLPANSSKLFDYWFEDCSSPYALSIIAIKMYLKSTKMNGLKTIRLGCTLPPTVSAKEKAKLGMTVPVGKVEVNVEASTVLLNLGGEFVRMIDDPVWRDQYPDQVGLNRLNHLQTTLSTLHTISGLASEGQQFVLPGPCFATLDEEFAGDSFRWVSEHLDYSRLKQPCYLSTEVEKVGSAPVSGGSFADVWKGIWANSHNGTQPVELKYLRQYMHMTDEIKEKLMLRYLEVDPEADQFALIHQIASAVSYLHNCQPVVITATSKASNILTSDDGQALLTDFGLSNVIEKVLESELSMLEQSFCNIALH
ncbi:uncharacterized protein F5891DRAFT_985621 [Suillus fuscotomentosus]|uniref:Protein kinase domain-containing protein n=1 Tax=Suillus fuscotomentosus TaxID=1912939 RepID=A0AAD4DTS3_9AGAM|nr:uncharacterized protein F5891DRAFT_985621 [Suillus fuscotomentosus]KAG1893716.1 hypothetical protein F5891DRAFT_985621 [Suillus fuscotomentosus]